MDGAGEMGSKPRRRIDAKRVLAQTREVAEPDLLDWILAFFYASEGTVPSRVHLQKALFIASKHLRDLAEVAEFKAYRMGAWSDSVHDALEQALANGWVTERMGQLELSELAYDRARSSWHSLSDKDRSVLGEIARFIKGMDRDELLLYTYLVYGGGEKSDVIDRLLRKRREIAESLLAKGLISTGLAAELAGMPYAEFVDHLRRKGVKPFTVDAGDVDAAASL
ncbi:MAG: UPF0175 family protein [Thermofilaceae archaeon]